MTWLQKHLRINKLHLLILLVMFKLVLFADKNKIIIDNKIEDINYNYGKICTCEEYLSGMLCKYVKNTEIVLEKDINYNLSLTDKCQIKLGLKEHINSKKHVQLRDNKNSKVKLGN